MTKHYVVLEFEQLHDGNLDNMPWADVLEGAVKVTNWRNITSKTIEAATKARFAAEELLHPFRNRK